MIVTAGGRTCSPTPSRSLSEASGDRGDRRAGASSKIVGLIVPKVGEAASGDAEATVRKAIADISRTPALVSALADFAVTRRRFPARASASHVGICWRDATIRRIARRQPGCRRAPRADVAGGDVGR